MQDNLACVLRANLCQIDQENENFWNNKEINKSIVSIFAFLCGTQMYLEICLVNLFDVAFITSSWMLSRFCFHAFISNYLIRCGRNFRLVGVLPVRLFILSVWHRKASVRLVAYMSETARCWYQLTDRMWQNCWSMLIQSARSSMIAQLWLEHDSFFDLSCFDHDLWKLSFSAQNWIVILLIGSNLDLFMCLGWFLSCFVSNENFVAFSADLHDKDACLLQLKVIKYVSSIHFLVIHPKFHLDIFR